jgi:hypothetical protein
MTPSELTAVILYCINKVFVGLVIGLLIVMTVNWFYKISPIGRDDTDEPGWFGERSDVVIVTDNATGLQYLKSDTGITPRLTSSGKQMVKQPQ